MSTDMKTSAKSSEPQPSKLKTIKKIEFIELNDDCLIHLLRYLPLKDLNAMSVTCHQLYEINARNVYKYQSSLKTYDIEAMTRRCHPKDLSKIESYLNRFGYLIQHIDFNMLILNKRHDLLFTFISKYCLAELKSLSISNVNLQSRTVLIGRPIFANLTKLETDNNLNWTAIFPLCANLKELHLLIEREHTPFEFNYDFPQLKVLTIKLKDIGNNEEFPSRFNVQNFVNLKSLSLTLPNMVCVSNIKQLLDLKELYLNIIASWDLLSLGALSKLEKIEIKTEANLNFSQFLCQSASVHTLQHLSIKRCSLNEPFIDGLSRFHHLRHLNLNTTMSTTLIADNVWAKLHQLNAIIKLEIDDDTETSEKFLKHLTGAHHTLHECESLTRRLTDRFVAHLTQFDNLTELFLGWLTVDIVDWQPFQRLTKLRQITLMNIGMDFSNQVQLNVLKNLAPFNTLEKIEFSGAVNIDAELIQTIKLFSNLKTLVLCSMLRLPSANVKIAMQQLSHITDFTMLGRTMDDSIEAFMELVEHWPTIDYLKLGHLQFSTDFVYIRNKLTQILKNRNIFDRLTISIDQESIRISAKI